MKEFRILIIAAHRMCISTILQSICVLTMSMCKVFCTWNNFTHCSAIYTAARPEKKGQIKKKFVRAD